MRHDFLPAAVTAGAQGVSEASAPACLIAVYICSTINQSTREHN
jgi:hypothetical protein